MVDLNEKFDVKLCQTQRRNLVIKQLEQPKAFFFLIQNEYYSDKRKEFFFFLHLLPTYFKRKYGEIHYILLYIIYGIRWTRRVNAEYDDACWWYEKKFGKKNSRWGLRKSGRYDSYFYYWTEAQYKVWNVDDFNVRWYLRSLLLCKWNSGIMSIKSRMLFNILSLFWSIVATIMSKYVLSSLIGISNVHELNCTWDLNQTWFSTRNHTYLKTLRLRFQMHNSA